MSTSTTHPPAPAGLMCDDPGAVSEWLRAHGDHVEGAVTVDRTGFGQSNITTVVTDAADRQWVLREPPPGRHAHSAHDVVREARILTALAGSPIPVPAVIGTGIAPGGGAFLVMEKVPGAPLVNEGDAAALPPQDRYELGLRVAGTLAALHTLDPAAVGLGDIGSAGTTPYVARQIRRLSANWERAGIDSGHDTAWQAVRTRLAAGVLDGSPTVLVHGDYRLSNLLIEGRQLTAVLDWELSTLGDPLADLAWLLDDWRQPGEPAIVMPSPTRAGGFPDRPTMVDHYCRATGFDVSRLGFYRGFSQWRAATLLQGVVARRRSGALGSHGDVDLDLLADSISMLLTAAAADVSAAA